MGDMEIVDAAAAAVRPPQTRELRGRMFVVSPPVAKEDFTDEHYERKYVTFLAFSANLRPMLIKSHHGAQEYVPSPGLYVLPLPSRVRLGKKRIRSIPNATAFIPESMFKYAERADVRRLRARVATLRLPTVEIGADIDHLTFFKLVESNISFAFYASAVDALEILRLVQGYYRQTGIKTIPLIYVSVTERGKWQTAYFDPCDCITYDAPPCSRALILRWRMRRRENFLPIPYRPRKSFGATDRAADRNGYFDVDAWHFYLSLYHPR